MAKVLKVVGAVVAIVGLAIVTGGAAAGLGISLATSFVGAGISISAGSLLLAGAVLSTAGSLLSPKPKAPTTSAATSDRLTVSVDLRATRKTIVGHTAMATDLRDQELSTDQSLVHRFIVTAAHRVRAYSEIWFDDKLAWTTTGGVQGDFVGYLLVTPVLEGAAANAINIGPRMGSSRHFTGCAYVYLRFKVTGNDKKAESPFASAIPTRVTIIGDGAYLYDPRLDSMVGGDGPMRADDQTTWTASWDDNRARNPALQALWYLLGWRIRNPVTGEWILSVGKGIPPARIDIPSFISGANLCDEPVAMAAGGTEPRYRSDGIFQEGDDLSTTLDNLKAAMNADIDDVDGKIRLQVLHNDLAAPIGSLTTDDVLGAFTWSQTPPLSDSVNVIRGSYVDPSTTSLYQMVDYPQVAIASPDGIDRIQTVPFATVESVSQAQRLAKSRLRRAQYGGSFQATFQATAWKFEKGNVIKFTFRPLGWIDKLFRIADMTIQIDGTVPMILREEHEDIYDDDATDAAPIAGAEPTTYNPLLAPMVQAIGDAEAQIAAIASDSILSHGSEKQAAAIDWNALLEDLSAVNASFVSIGSPAAAVAAHDAANAAVSDLGSSFEAAWDDGATDTPIDAATWVAKWGQAYASLATFRAALTSVSFDLLDVLIDGKGRAFWQATPPTAEESSEGDLWFETSNGNFLYRRIAGSGRLAFNGSKMTFAGSGLIVPPWAPAPDQRIAQALSQAASAILQAEAAQATADSAIAAIETLADDGILSISEKITVLIPRDAQLEGAWELLDEQAADLGITTERTAAAAARSAWQAYRDSLSPAWNSISADTPVDRDTFRGKLDDYDAALAALQKAISAKAATTADWDGVTGAGKDALLADLAAAQARIVALGSDSVLSAGSEKQEAIIDWTALDNQFDALQAKYVALGSPADVTAARDAASTALTALSTYLSGLTPTWDDVGSDTPIVSATWQGKWNDAGNGIAAFVAAITGRPGADGFSRAQIKLYQRAAAAPAVPAAMLTYTFATDAIAGSIGAWSRTPVAANGNPQYVTAASAVSNTATDTIATGEWAAPIIETQDGSRSALVTIFKRSAAIPAVPAATLTYDFPTGTITAGALSGWTIDPPAHDGNPLYIATATALAPASATTDTIGAAEWAPPQIQAIDGSDGNYKDVKFIRSLAQPATPIGDDPAGWSDGVPAGTDTIWEIIGDKTFAGALIGGWSTPQTISSLVNRGNYSATDTYYLNNVVQFAGGSYIAVADNFSGQQPSGTASATAYWDVQSSPGTAGPPAIPPSAFTASINLPAGSAVNLYDLAVANGYTGHSDATVTFTVPNGVTIRGLGGFSGVGGIGIDTGNWPTADYTIALTLVIASGAVVDGGGGRGGSSGTGYSGGDAIFVRTPMLGGITIGAGGTVRAGGGGGGANHMVSPYKIGTGGGGGGAPNGGGGEGTEGSTTTGTSGHSGTTAGGGVGGTGGGAGGTFATAGSASTQGSSGGPAGFAVRKNSNAVTVTNNGTMTGSAA